ncbi:hypothetical protein C8Q80DRAFT_57114 [Daedaleopsis nitida]|nr:hypothetical protein C8Q80DRAFT_57114 [Daedaleopsis nitida]
MPNAGSPSSTHANSGDGDFWDVVEITDERRGLFKVKWAGVDPATGKSWPQSWVKSGDCTEDLIVDWKRKQRIKKEAAARRKSGGTKTRAPATLSRTKKDSRSSSTATTTRQTRHSTTNVPTTPTSKASSSRPDGAAAREHSSPRKRRRTTVSEDVESRRDESSRPVKKRKLEVKVVEPVKSGPSQEPESSYEVIARKKIGKHPLNLREESSDDDAAGRRQNSPPQSTPNGKSRAADKRHPNMVDENDEEERGEDMDEPVMHHAVPVTKVGPPRTAKRRKGEDGKSLVRNATAGGQRTKDRFSRQLPSTGLRTESGVRSPSPPSKSSSLRTAQTTKTRPVGTSGPPQVPGPSRSSSSRPEVVDATDDDQPATTHLWEVIDVTDDVPAPLSPDSRRLLMQEEEENTQEAAGFISPSPLFPPKSPQAALEGLLNPGPSKTAVHHGRPFAHDTFSRDGIVPETQTTHAADILDEPPYDPTQDDLDAEQDIPDVPSTPVRPRSDVHQSSPSNPSSVVAKMQSRSRGKRKELRPIHLLPLPDFCAYLNATQTEEIDSSPEKDSPPKQRTLGPLTQDTIEDDEPEDMINRFVDWTGGVQNRLDMRPEEPFGQRSHSPEIPLQEPPPTSTTQRADADSQSISQPNSQVVELTAALEEKSEQLSLLEGQIEGLQERIAELELVQAKDRTAHESELKALREVSEEKTEQISLLENQLVELELQLTQLKDNDNRFDHQIRELNELLEERSEQVLQLENTLLELHTQVEALELEKQELTEKIQRHGARVGQSDETEQAAAQRLAALEEDLASAREKLSKAQQVVTSLSDRLETTTREWTQQLKYAEEKRDLFQKLYSDASTHAQRLARENTELEERATRAEGQVKDGLQMVRATSAQQVKALQAEVGKWKGMYQVGAERDMRTDDEVRRRAALEPGLQEENARLRVDLQIANREVADLKAIIEQLSAAQGQAGEGYNEDEDEDFMPDSDIASSSSSSSSPGERSVRPESSNGALSHSPALELDEEEIICQYVEGPVMCNARFATIQEAIDHACEAHYRKGTLVTL